MNKVFTYGTLMCEDILQTIVDQHECLGTTRLQGFRRLCIRNEHYPGIIQASDYEVQGIVYNLPQQDSLHKLDYFEGDMYQRIPVSVELDNGDCLQAFTYVIKDHYRHMLEQKDWDFEVFKKHYKSAFITTYSGFAP